MSREQYGVNRKKLEKIIENAFGAKKIDKLKEILQKEINIDE